MNAVAPGRKAEIVQAFRLLMRRGMSESDAIQTVALEYSVTPKEIQEWSREYRNGPT